MFKTSGKVTPPRMTVLGGLAAILLPLLAQPSMGQTATVSAYSLVSNWITANGNLTLPDSSGVGNFTIPTPAGADGMLVVTIAGEVGTEPSTITWGGQTMTKATSRATGTGNGAGYSGIWYLANPTAGTSTLNVAGYVGNRFSAYAVYATGVNAMPQTSATGGNSSGTSTIDTDTPASITPAGGSFIVTSFGGSPTGAGTDIVSSKIVKFSDNSEPSQTTPPRAPNIGSIAASGHMIASDSSPLKGRTTVTNTGGNRAVTIVSFAPAGAAVFDNLLVEAPASVQAGQSFLVTITARDSSNVTVDDSTTTVTLSSLSALMEFSWDGDEVYGDNSGTLLNGVKVIRARNKKAETTNISANGGGGVPVPDSVETTVGPFTKLQILAPGEIAAAGTSSGKVGTPSTRSHTIPFNVIVNAVDENWNLVNTVTDTVGITSSDPNADLPASAPLAAGTNTFLIALQTPLGSFTATATNETDGSKSPDTTPILPMQTTLFWEGDGVANLWDTTANNWIDLGSNVIPYGNGASAVFNDDSANRTVDLVGTLAPASISVSNTTGSYTFGSSSGGLISGTTGLAKSGAGTLTISTANTYTGLTSLSGGILSVNTIADSGGSAIGFGPLTLSGGTLSYTGTGAATTARAINQTSSSTIEVSEASGSLTLSGTVSNQTLTKTGPGTLILSGATDNGFLVLNAAAGEVQLGKAGSGVRAVAGIGGIASGATVKLNGPGSDQIFGGANTVNYGVNGMVSGGTLNLNGFSEAVSHLNGTGGTVDGGSGTVTLTVGQSDVSSAFGGAIQNTSGTLNLVKTGAGTVTLSGANTYTGTTAVNSGRLALVGSSHSSAITVAASASLGFTLGSPATSTAAVTLTAGTVAITGTVDNATDYQLMTAASFTGPFNLSAAISGYQLETRAGGTQLWLARDNPFAVWAGAGVNFGDDANQDGVDNGLAWLLGAANKDSNALGHLPAITQTGGDLKMSFKMLPASARGASQLFLEYGNDLATWSAGVLVPGASGGAAPVTFVVVDTDLGNPDNLLDVEATVSSTAAGGGKLFGRLKAVK